MALTEQSPQVQLLIFELLEGYCPTCFEKLTKDAQLHTAPERRNGM